MLTCRTSTRFPSLSAVRRTSSQLSRWLALFACGFAVTLLSVAKSTARTSQQDDRKRHEDGVKTNQKAHSTIAPSRSACHWNGMVWGIASVADYNGFIGS